MKHWWVPIVAVTLTCGAARAQEDDTVDKVQTDMVKLFREANTKGTSPVVADFLPLIDRCWKIYDVSAGEPEEFDTLNEVLMLCSYAPGRDVKIQDQWRDAMGKLVKDHVDDARMATLIEGIRAPSGLEKELEASLATLQANTKSPDLKAAFAFKPLQALIGQQSDGALNDAQTAELIAKLKKLAADYPDAKVPRYGVTYKEWVAKKIYTIEHLKKGATVPEVEGQDLDGVKFKLSDYRGKVVLLDFWGYW